MINNRYVSCHFDKVAAIEVSGNGDFSSASYTLFLNSDPDVCSKEVRDFSEDLIIFESRILGRSHDLEGGFDNAATEFTEIIKWDISKLSSEDKATWMDVASSIRYCAMVTESWADSVKTYKDERKSLIERWNEEAQALATGLNEAPPSISFMWTEAPAQEAESALEELKNEIQELESTAYQKLNEAAETTESDLRSGPTTESIERLIDSGYITWSYFNLGGDVDAIPIDKDPDEMAEEVAEYASDPENYNGDISEIAAVLGNLGIVAMQRQGSGEDMSAEELEFLTEFYDALEGEGANQVPPGVLSVTDSIRENIDIPPDVREDLLRGLGNGVLVLSDESIGGSYERLPDSIRSAVEGPILPGQHPEDETQGQRDSWLLEAYSLATLLENTTPELAGGQQFSVNLTQSASYYLDSQNDADFYAFGDEQLESLVDAGTRNEDANHAILTGEGPYEHPVLGLDRDMVLRGLYTHDWPDDSEAITGLTDWIWEQNNGTEEERLRAAEAAAGLIEGLNGVSVHGSERPDDLPEDAYWAGDKEFDRSIFLDTGVEVDGNANAATTEINPALAESFSKIFYSYINDFGGSSNGDIPAAVVTQSEASVLPMHSAGDVTMGVGEAHRENFLQLLFANEEAGPNVLLAIVEQEQNTMREALFTGDHEPSTYAAESGKLRDLADRAMLSEYASRAEGNAEAIEAAEKKIQVYWETAYKVGTHMTVGGASAIPVGGIPASTGVNIISTLLEEPMKNSISEYAAEQMEELERELENNERNLESTLGGDDNAKWHMQVQLGRLLIEEGLIDVEDFEGTGVLVGEEDGGFSYPASPNDWPFGSAGRTEALMEVVNKIPDSEFSGRSAEELVSDYLEGYMEAYQEPGADFEDPASVSDDSGSQ